MGDSDMQKFFCTTVYNTHLWQGFWDWSVWTKLEPSLVMNRCLNSPFFPNWWLKSISIESIQSKSSKHDGWLQNMHHVTLIELNYPNVLFLVELHFCFWKLKNRCRCQAPFSFLTSLTAGTAWMSYVPPFLKMLTDSMLAQLGIKILQG